MAYYGVVLSLYLQNTKKVFPTFIFAVRYYLYFAVVTSDRIILSKVLYMSCFTVRTHYFYRIQTEEWDVDFSSPREDGVSTMDN